MARFILDTRLSEANYVLCTEAIRRNIIEPEDLNEGRRTMAEQWQFWNNQPPLAAFPSPFAPHIKKGLPNHAIDVNSLNGAAQRLADFYRSQGVPVEFNVPGEGWHMDVLSASKLRAAAKRIRKQRDRAVLKPGEREPAVKFLKHQLHFIKDPDTREPYFKPDGKRPDEGWGVEFTPDLASAVRRFQRDRDLAADGAVGMITNRKIDAAYRRAQKRRKRASAKERAVARKQRELEGV